MPPKIVFFDIDDTLYLKHERRIPASTRDALHQLNARDIITAIATGRTPAVLPEPIRRLMDDTGMEMLVAVNGQYVEYRGRPLAQFAMPPVQAEAVSGSLKAHGISHGFVSAERISVAAADEPLHRSLGDLAIPYEADSGHVGREPVYQMLAFYPESRDAEIAALLPPQLKTVRWHPQGVDIIERAGSKARGIRAALNALGLEMADAMTFGDGPNHREMLEAVGFGVAMGNAPAELKAVARHVCPAAAEDGIARGLRELGLID